MGKMGRFDEAFARLDVTSTSVCKRSNIPGMALSLLPIAGTDPVSTYGYADITRSRTPVTPSISSRINR